MDRFVVGTGRCGSTLLSRMLACHPDVLSIFEFFTGLDRGQAFGTGSVPGAELAGLLAAPQPVLNAVLDAGHIVAEVTYDFDAPGSRFTRSNIPWLASTMLPRISDDVDRDFDALIVWASRQPPRLIGEHFMAVFAWLCDRYAKPVWIERSGSSVEYVGALARLFPDAVFVHLVRDGTEVALSMREHAAYRLAAGILYPPDDSTTPAGLDATLADDNWVDGLIRQRREPEVYGRYWSDQLEAGIAALGLLDPERRIGVKFEDLVTSPRDVLTRIGDFFDLEPGTWIDDAARLVREVPHRRASDLSDAERARLMDACRRGRNLVEDHP